MRITGFLVEMERGSLPVWSSTSDYWKGMLNLEMDLNFVCIKGELTYKFKISSIRWRQLPGTVFSPRTIKRTTNPHAKGTALSNSFWLLFNFSIMAIKRRSLLPATNPAHINCRPIFKSLLWSQKRNHEQYNRSKNNLFGYLSRRS